MYQFKETIDKWFGITRNSSSGRPYRVDTENFPCLFLEKQGVEISKLTKTIQLRKGWS